ncbi:toxin, RelE family protein [Nostoc linckia z18]|uniref:Toxin, RelE family protein n=2 Tax=Nostoc linckia TaxID=92942 RepID=A0A9Q5ZEL5_NOSLI|nr:type II toxin-antitoxin system RelE/ParE family toxin [Nostoc linckia]PHK42772.1 toxin, RelE family protein [Nostoc linckia z15]PHK47395.1 toxin, RelE family protein [Nostoc linckia z16]PHJ61997.1 toxin, RelE family protein [Nostoc linckia z1]PHJ66350.1 toxin, RelE family protein [Nostoc linckia z3]PHJ73118.1 toxin, RelE family protein [Nostoc linckia z2]
MSYQLIISPEAELDIQDAFEWYEQRDSGLGSEFVRAIDSCLALIGRNPLAYPVVYRQARRALIRRFPYGVIYVVEENVITVIACYHVKRNPKQWQNRNI